MVAGLLMEWKRQQDVQNPLAADQEKRFLVRFLWQGDMYPVAGCCVA
jgi:hypothetical protein